MSSTYIESRDGERLKLQQDKVRALMKDGYWRTLEEISLMTGAPPASASARLRQLRKEGYEVQREYLRRGLWKYRVLASPDFLLHPPDPVEGDGTHPNQMGPWV